LPLNKEEKMKRNGWILGCPIFRQTNTMAIHGRRNFQFPTTSSTRATASSNKSSCIEENLEGSTMPQDVKDLVAQENSKDITKNLHSPTTALGRAQKVGRLGGEESAEDQRITILYLEDTRPLVASPNKALRACCNMLYYYSSF
jgi:hypothetical protein